MSKPMVPMASARPPTIRVAGRTARPDSTGSPSGATRRRHGANLLGSRSPHRGVRARRAGACRVRQAPPTAIVRGACGGVWQRFRRAQSAAYTVVLCRISNLGRSAYRIELDALPLVATRIRRHRSAMVHAGGRRPELEFARHRSADRHALLRSPLAQPGQGQRNGGGQREHGRFAAPSARVCA